jgi:hypothetical protein
LAYQIIFFAAGVLAMITLVLPEHEQDFKQVAVLFRLHQAYAFEFSFLSSLQEHDLESVVGHKCFKKQSGPKLFLLLAETLPLRFRQEVL